MPPLSRASRPEPDSSARGRVAARRVAARGDPAGLDVAGERGAGLRVELQHLGDHRGRVGGLVAHVVLVERVGLVVGERVRRRRHDEPGGGDLRGHALIALGRAVQPVAPQDQREPAGGHARVALRRAAGRARRRVEDQGAQRPAGAGEGELADADGEGLRGCLDRGGAPLFGGGRRPRRHRPGDAERGGGIAVRGRIGRRDIRLLRWVGWVGLAAAARQRDNEQKTGDSAPHPHARKLRLSDLVRLYARLKFEGSYRRQRVACTPSPRPPALLRSFDRAVPPVAVVAPPGQTTASGP